MRGCQRTAVHSEIHVYRQYSADALPQPHYSLLAGGQQINGQKCRDITERRTAKLSAIRQLRGTVHYCGSAEYSHPQAASAQFDYSALSHVASIVGGTAANSF